VADVLRAAVIGAGGIGRHHVRILADRPGTVLVGVADPDPATRLLAETHGTRWFPSYEDMLEQTHPHAVTIAAPTPMHHRIAMACLTAGIATLVEKPLARTVAEGRELVATALATGTVLTVGHVERYNPVVRRLRALVEEGVVGEITSIVARRIGGFPRREPMTDVVTDLAVHDLDLAAMLAGGPLTLLAAHGSRTHHSTEIDSVHILCGRGQISVSLEANWITPVKVRSISVTGSQGYVEANYITQELTSYRMPPMEPQKDFAAFVAAFGAPESRIERCPLEEPLGLELSAFLKAAASLDTTGLVSPGDALDALSLAIDARTMATA
jgi:UDP-N-acetylglucosamine 3-dehydrogenase